jgi:transposase
MLYHAIDLHKRTLEAATLMSGDEGGPEVVRMPACERALGTYLAQWPASRHRVVVETTGAWYWVADLLRERGAELKLAHAAKVRAITAAKVKTDSIDAVTLLTMLRLNLVPGPELRELRDLLRMRLRLIEKHTSAKNSIARLLEKYNRASVEALPELAQVQVSFHRGQISLLSAQIKALEKHVHRELRPNPIVRRLRRIPGIGRLGA